MTNTTKLLLAGALATVTSCSSATSATPEPAPSRPQHGRVQVDGVDYYYERHGQGGTPIVLLHGGLMSIDAFRPIIPSLTERGRQVIAIDLHGHGRTTLGDRPITLAGGGNDVAAVLDAIGVAQADVVGYSFGGGVALQLAAKHPAKVRRLVLVSTPYAQTGWYPEMLPQQAAVSAQMLPMMKSSPLYAAYAAVAPKDEFGRLLDRMGELMRTSYDFSADVKQLAAKTLLVYGDSDMVHYDHIVAFYKLLGGGQRDAGWQREHMGKNRLAILPDATHYDIFQSPLLVPTIRAFVE